MKKIRLFTLMLFGFGVLGIFGFSTLLESDGAPAGSTGSPGDNNSCANSACHGNTGTITNQTITISVSPEGNIIQGMPYEISVKLVGPGHSRMGFQATVEKDSDNSKLGLFGVTSTQAQIVDDVYVTHTSSGTSTNTDTIEWTFQWTPPSTFIGDATIYAAANFTNNNNANTGDIIGLEDLGITVIENIGLAELNESLDLTILPNPSTDQVNLSFFLKEPSDVKIQIIDLNGRSNIVLVDKTLEQGQHSFSEKVDIASGIYLVYLNKGTERYVQKLIIK